MKFKVGDRVMVKSWGHSYSGWEDPARDMRLKKWSRHSFCYYKNGDPSLECTVVGVSEKYSLIGVLAPNGSEYVIGERGCELIEHKKSKMSSLIQKFKLSMKSEPEKSFIKAGVIHQDEELTTDGKELFNAFLFNKHKAEFKKEVVDPILAEQEVEKK